MEARHAEGWNPVADPQAVVVSGEARFTVLTPRVVRMEWSEDGRFEDRATLVFVNRRLPVPAFHVGRRRGWLIVRTGALTLRYREGSGSFGRDNLRVDFDTGGLRGRWWPGKPNRRNLGGTAMTLDNCDGDRHILSGRKLDLGQGLISREGWALIDDTGRPVFEDSDWPWVTPRPQKPHQDYVLFCYGLDFKAALADFVRLAGRVPIPPKFVFGYWWSRYWEYTDVEFRQLVREFEEYGLPLDVLVIDMDWHITSRPEWFRNGKKVRDQAGQPAGWTGFTWNRNYFPDPEAFLRWAKASGLKVSLNLHPASGIQPHEEKYPEMARAMGVDPRTRKYVPFDIVDRHFAEHLMKIVLHPMEKQGVDFWWLDWQQWSTTRIPGVNPVFYLNYVFFTDMERRGEKRPVIFHRYGGLGNHRYPIGFSGDAVISWRSLAYQPYFTATAANVCFSYWSHDIGGHIYGKDDPERFTRWVQFGAFSPVLRTHCTKDPDLERRIWAYPLPYYRAMREVVLLREALFPYTYTAARRTYETGVSLCRPLYHEHPELEEAYRHRDHYFFGDDMLVAPVTARRPRGHLLVRKKVWLPPGRWVEWFTGTVLEGDRTHERTFALDEVPVYVREGAIVPMQPRMRRIGEKPIDPLILTIFPGREGSTAVYDDAGDDLGYLQGEFTWTRVGFEQEPGGALRVVIDPVEGECPGMPRERSYELRFPLRLPPTRVRVNGEELRRAEGEHDEDCWYFDPEELEVRVRTRGFDVREKVEVEIHFPEVPVERLSGMKGKLRRLRDFMNFLAGAGWDRSRYSNDVVVRTGQTGLAISLWPERAEEEVRRFEEGWRRVLEMVRECAAEKSEFAPYVEYLETAGANPQR